MAKSKAKKTKTDPIKKAHAIPCSKLFSETVKRLQKMDYKFGERTLEFRFVRGPELTNGETEAAVELIEAGIRQYVEHASMGWSRDEKTRQVKDPTSRLILVYPSSDAVGDTTEALGPGMKQPANEPGDSPTKDLAALVCLRFEPEEDSDPDSLPVVYCYEIHVAPTYRRGGLGRFLMLELAHIAKTTKMDRVMLTVMRDNEQALAFYNAMGFYTDEGSPDDTDYHILSMDPQ